MIARRLPGAPPRRPWVAQVLRVLAGPSVVLRRFDTRTLITLGLVSMLTSALLLASALGLVPRRDAILAETRAPLAEVLAAASMGALSTGDTRAVDDLLGFALERDATMRSAAVRRADGALHAVAGEHAGHWRVLPDGRSDADQLVVPLYASGARWGQLELRFEPAPAGVLAVLLDPRVHGLVLVAGLCAIGFWLYLGRALRLLDPSRAVPDRVRGALDTLAEGLLLIDATGRVVLANEAFRTLHEAAGQATVGRPADRLGWTGPQGVPLAADALPWAEALRSGHTVRQRPVSLVDRDGTRRSFLANCAPVGAGDGVPAAGVLVSLDDVTELQRKEAQLREATERAQAASRAKSDFLANMSHEIRTPMNAILGFTEMLRRGRAADAGQARRHLDTIHANGAHLLALINDILDLSKVEAGRLDVERVPVAPHEVIVDVVETLSVRAAEKGVGLRCAFDGPVPERVAGDPARLRQVLTNLVGNALKFTERGEVVVTERWRPATDGAGARLSIEVRDSGIGIPADKLGAIFEPFVQADASTTRRFGGTGLGLAISRRYARAMGGDIVVSSEPGRGSTFTLTLEPGADAGHTLVVPELDRGARAAASVPGVAWRFPPRHLLVVDDSPDNRELVALILEDSGLVVELADSGEAALAAIARRTPDLVLMDMQMPGMDGFTATRLLRERGFAKPVLAFTAHALQGFESEIRAAGCDGYLTKPIDVDAMMATLAARLDGERVAAPQDDARSAVAFVAPDAPPASPASTASTASTARTGATASGGSDPSRVADVAGLADATVGADADGSGPLRSRLAGHPRLGAIAAAFAGRLPERIARMRAALDRGDLAALADDAHWLKGSAGSVGFDAFTAPARGLEAAARADDPPACAAALARIEALGRRVAGADVRAGEAHAG